MAILVGSGAGASNPVIGYDNLLEQGTVTASDEATGFAKEFAYNWLDYDYWKPSSAGVAYLNVELSAAQTANYLGLYAHDLGTNGATVTLEYSFSGLSGPWYQATTTSPVGTECLLLKFTDTTAATWRVRVDSPSVPSSIGCVAFGNLLTMSQGIQAGFSPPLANAYEVKNNTSRNNRFLGRTLQRSPVDVSASFIVVDPTWARTYWQPFIDQRAQQKPFFFAWDSVSHLSEVVWMWTESKTMAPIYSHNLYMSISLQGRGYVE